MTPAGTTEDRQACLIPLPAQMTADADRRRARAAAGGRTSRLGRTLNSRTSYTDAQLIGGCIGNDPAAWDELVQRYSRLVYSVPLKYGLPAAAADDIFQQVFLTVYRRLESLRDANRFSGWLLRMAHRQTMRHRRNNLGDSGLDFVPDGSELPGDLASKLEDQHIVRQALQLLSPRDRQLLNALFFDDVASYAQVAERLQIPVGSIGPTRARCLRRLERALIQCGYSPNHATIAAA